MSARPLRILQVNYEYPPLGGGGGIAHRDIAEALARRHDVRVLTTHFRGLPAEETAGGVRIRRVGVWGRTALPTATIRSMISFAPRAVAGGFQLIRSWRPDVIHALFAVPSGLPAVLLGRLFGIPVVLTLIGADVFDPHPTAGVSTHENPALRSVVRWVIGQATAVSAISDDTRQRAVTYHRAPSDLPIIPLGLVPPVALPDRRHQGRDAPFRLVTIGRLIPRKTIHLLLEALSRLSDVPVPLDIIGDGPLRAALRQRAAELGLSSRVHFHGAVSDEEKWQLLRNADGFISASAHEGFGMVFLEAMYAGLPIIATTSGGQTDILRSGEHALLVPPGRVDHLAHAIRLLSKDSSLRERMAEANRRQVQAFLIGRTVAAYEDLFRSVTGHRVAAPVAASAASHG